MNRQHTRNPLSRRDFLKLTTLSAGVIGLETLGLPRWFARPSLAQGPASPRLGRVVWWGTELKTGPSLESQTVRALREDELFPWLRERVGSHFERNQTWVETPEGYIWAPHLQPVYDRPNQPSTTLPTGSLGSGVWVEVSVPFVDMLLENPPARSPWLSDRLDAGLAPRLYFSQIVWIDQVRTDTQGRIWYRVNERFGYGDIFWAPAEAFRSISLGEMEPISPEIEEKSILVDVGRQSLTCFEGRTEVYYCRCSTGALWDYLGNRVDAWATPVGSHVVWRKLVSLHMSGGTTGGGWDLPGIGWTTLFVGTGVAIHSTFWHNNFGVPMSRGCVNVRPEDASWVFRWTQPIVPYDPGDVTVPLPGGTLIRVIEA